MYISPCGWFCFQVPEQWRSLEKADAVFLVSMDESSMIEMTSARRDTPLREGELIQMHEDYLKQEAYRAEDTRCFQNTQGVECVLSALSNGNHLVVVSHLSWSRYALFLEMDTPLDENIEDSLSSLQEIIESLEPLTVD